MEIFGLHENIKGVRRRLAKLGAFAVAAIKAVDVLAIAESPFMIQQRRLMPGFREWMGERPPCAN